MFYSCVNLNHVIVDYFLMLHPSKLLLNNVVYNNFGLFHRAHFDLNFSLPRALRYLVNSTDCSKSLLNEQADP